MRSREKGFTFIEMTIAMAIVMVILYGAINFFIVSVRQFKVQTKITETNLEGIMGLEILRKDLESLGFGLPWNNLTAYTEVASGDASLTALNDSPNAPRAVVGIDCAVFTLGNSDYLVIRSASVGTGSAPGKWTHLAQGNVKRSWTPASENLQNGNSVIVLAIGSTDANRRSLVNPGTFYTTYGSTALYVPSEPYSANIVYGIHDSDPPVRPFNRADYYIGSTAVPQRCAPGTGVLYKAVVAQDAAGTMPNPLPLLDCVGDMQVAYGIDNNTDGWVDVWLAALPSTLTAADIRAQLAEVHVSILAQEGQRDDSYTHPAGTVFVGSHGVGRSVDVSAQRNYRWKTYTVAVKPLNLAQ